MESLLPPMYMKLVCKKYSYWTKQKQIYLIIKVPNSVVYFRIKSPETL